MFSLHDFIMDGLFRAVGKMADFQVILNAVGWHTKAVLTTEDLETLAAKIAEKDAKEEEAARRFAEAAEAEKETSLSTAENTEDAAADIAEGGDSTDTDTEAAVAENNAE